MTYKQKQDVEIGKVCKFFKHIFPIVRQKQLTTFNLEGTVIAFDGYVKDNQHGRVRDREKSLRLKINGKYYVVEKWIIEDSAGKKTYGYKPVEIVLDSMYRDNTSIRERLDFVVDNKPTALTDSYEYWTNYTNSIYIKDSVEKKYECPLFLKRQAYEEHKVKILTAVILGNTSIKLTKLSRLTVFLYLRFTQTPTLETHKTWREWKIQNPLYYQVIDKVFELIDATYEN